MEDDSQSADRSPGTWRTVPALVERLKPLRCVASVARHGSVMRAAEAIHMSQPAVTRAVRDLEASFGLPLFERAARGMLPTALGARAAQRADVLCDHLAQGAAESLALATRVGRRGATALRFAAAVSPRSLKALVALATGSSETRAARSLGISQPAVHQALSSLEDLAGVALFQKSVRGTRLTDSGEALLRRVKLAFGEVRALETDIASWRGEIRGRVVVGALPLSVTAILPQAVETLGRLHPEVEITVVDGTYDSLMRQLRSADIDLVLGALRPLPADVRQETLLEEDLVVVARCGHPCLSRPSLVLGDLLQWEWVVPLPDTPASAALERAFSSCRLRPPSGALQAGSPPFTYTMIRRSDRLAVTSRGQALEDERAGLFRIVPVQLPGTARPIGAAVRAAGEASLDLAALLVALRDASHPLSRNLAD